MLARGVPDINATSPGHGSSVLHIAAGNGWADVCSLVLKAPNSRCLHFRNRFGVTALWYTLCLDREAVARVLRDAGLHESGNDLLANRVARVLRGGATSGDSVSGESASVRASPPRASPARASPPPARASPPVPQGALLEAAARGDRAACLSMLARGVPDINAKRYRALGASVLHLAAGRGWADVCSLVLTAPNSRCLHARNFFGGTALWYALTFAPPEARGAVARVLREAGSPEF